MCVLTHRCGVVNAGIRVRYVCMYVCMYACSRTIALGLDVLDPSSRWLHLAWVWGGGIVKLLFDDDDDDDDDDDNATATATAAAAACALFCLFFPFRSLRETLAPLPFVSGLADELRSRCLRTMRRQVADSSSASSSASAAAAAAAAAGNRHPQWMDKAFGQVASEETLTTSYTYGCIALYIFLSTCKERRGGEGGVCGMIAHRMHVAETCYHWGWGWWWWCRFVDVLPLGKGKKGARERNVCGSPRFPCCCCCCFDRVESIVGLYSCWHGQPGLDIVDGVSGANTVQL